MSRKGHLSNTESGQWEARREIKCVVKERTITEHMEREKKKGVRETGVGGRERGRERVSE